MESTIIIAKILGIYFLVSGVFLVTKKKTLATVLKDFFEHRAISYLAGIVLVFAGAALVLTHNVWTSPISSIDALISWITLIKGTLYVLFPEALISFVKQLNRGVISLLGLVMLVFGVYFVFYL